MLEEANSTLSFKEFAFMAHDFGIVPNIVTIIYKPWRRRRALQPQCSRECRNEQTQGDAYASIHTGAP
eukprot:scaffold98856_cov20-Prasinocladus_malaysianus.AAC.1